MASLNRLDIYSMAKRRECECFRCPIKCREKHEEICNVHRACKKHCIPKLNAGENKRTCPAYEWERSK